MNNIVPFKFENNNICFEADNKGSFIVVAKDIAENLGYKWGLHLLDKVPEEWKGVRPFPTTMGSHNIAYLTEQGLYFFLGRSDKPKALPFQKWICEKVLPSIRETGRYSLNKTDRKSVTHDRLLAKEIRLQVNSLNRFFADTGLTGNQKNLAVNKYLKNRLGIDIMAEAGVPYLVAPTNEPLLNPSDPGDIFVPNIKADRVSRELTTHRYQLTLRGNKNDIYYELTQKGIEAGGVYLDTGRRHNDGTPVRQLKWPASVVELLKRDMGL